MFLSEFELALNIAPNIVIASLFYLNTQMFDPAYEVVRVK